MCLKRTLFASAGIVAFLGFSTVFAEISSINPSSASTVTPQRVEMVTNMRGQTVEFRFVSQADFAKVNGTLERQFEYQNIDNCIETSPGNCTMSGSNMVVFMPN